MIDLLQTGYHHMLRLQVRQKLHVLSLVCAFMRADRNGSLVYMLLCVGRGFQCLVNKSFVCVHRTLARVYCANTLY